MIINIIVHAWDCHQDTKSTNYWEKSGYSKIHVLYIISNHYALYATMQHLIYSENSNIYRLAKRSEFWRLV